jgi:hypothetical protein
MFTRAKGKRGWWLGRMETNNENMHDWWGRREGRRVREKRGRITRRRGLSRRKLLLKMGHNKALRNTVKVKVKFTLEQATKNQMGSRVIALLYL